MSDKKIGVYVYTPVYVTCVDEDGWSVGGVLIDDYILILNDENGVEKVIPTWEADKIETVEKPSNLRETAIVL